MRYKLKEDYSNDYDIPYLLDRLNAFCQRLKPLLPAEEYYKLFSKPKTEITNDEYKYREACHTYVADNGEIRWSKWDRIPITKTSHYIKEHEDEEVFMSVQKFRHPEKVSNEDFVMPLFFDFDVDNYEPIVLAATDCIKVINKMEKIGIPQNHILISFSGNKGFHVVVSEIVFGMYPCNSLHRKIEHIHKKLEEELKLKTLCGSSGSRKMLRVQNTINRKSGLYKINISKKDLYNIDTILNEAKKPRKTQTARSVSLIPTARDWFFGLLKDYKTSPISSGVVKTLDFTPPCIQELLDSGIQARGTRNKSTIILASFFKNSGVTEDECMYRMEQWTEKLNPDLTSSKNSARILSMKTCIKSVYRSDNYKFECSYIKSLPWEIKCLDNCKLREK